MSDVADAGVYGMMVVYTILEGLGTTAIIMVRHLQPVRSRNVALLVRWQCVSQFTNHALTFAIGTTI